MQSRESHRQMKLALKSQADDLLNKSRARYGNGQKTNVSMLRPPYNELAAKLLTLVRDSDPSLARTITGSREAIRGILADADQFKAEVRRPSGRQRPHRHLQARQPLPDIRQPAGAGGRNETLARSRFGLTLAGVSQDEDAPLVVTDVDIAARVHHDLFGPVDG